MKTFLIEENNLETAVKRATRVLRFTVSSSTNKTPFGIFLGRKPRNLFNNLIDLEHQGKDLAENVYDSTGRHIIQWSSGPENLKKFKFDRTYGRSAGDEHLIEEQKKRQVRKYFG